MSSELPDGSVGARAPSTDLSAEACDAECVRSLLTETTRADGPAAGIATYYDLADAQPGLSASCHGLFHVIGRAAAHDYEKHLGFRSRECQYGYIHGFMQGVAAQQPADTAVSAVEEVCASFDDEVDVVNCFHGAGHAMSLLAPTDLVATLEYCSMFETSTSSLPARLCADGALMEFGDDRLLQVGLLDGNNAASTESTGEPTDVSGIDPHTLCASLPVLFEGACASRLWMFVVSPDGPPVDAVALCEKFDDPESAEECYIGFGQWEIQQVLGTPEALWPPTTPREADDVARLMADICEATTFAAECFLGVIPSTISHLYAAGFANELVPDVCSYVDSVHDEACTQATRRAELVGGVTVEP